MEYYRQKKDEIAKELNTDLKQGLSAKEAQEKLAQVGPNALVEGKKKITFQVFLEPVSYTHLTLPTTCTRCRSRWSPYH